MHIVTLQLDAVLGDVEGNIRKANELLSSQKDVQKELDLLVLPELAFSGTSMHIQSYHVAIEIYRLGLRAFFLQRIGYNYASYADIEPYLEPTSAGPSTLWAQRTAQSLQCVVAIGYPEKDVSITPLRAYNSLVFVNALGEVIAHTRKCFLYYTDETWAVEGQGFFTGKLPLGISSKATKKVAAGICMDINPYKFQAPWTAYEFANHALTSGAEVVVLSMAWLTRLSMSDLQKQSTQPDLDTVRYWLERLKPLRGSSGHIQEVIVVFANRCGEEGEAPLIGPVRYAGSSTVMGFRRRNGQFEREVRIWEMLGRAEEGVLSVDTESAPKYGLKRALPAENIDGGDEVSETSNHD